MRIEDRKLLMLQISSSVKTNEPGRNLGLAVLCGAVDLQLSIYNPQVTINLTMVDRGLALVDCWVPGTGLTFDKSFNPARIRICHNDLRSGPLHCLSRALVRLLVQVRARNSLDLQLTASSLRSKSSERSQSLLGRSPSKACSENRARTEGGVPRRIAKSFGRYRESGCCGGPLSAAMPTEQGTESRAFSKPIRRRPENNRVRQLLQGRIRIGCLDFGIAPRDILHEDKALRF